MKTKYYRQCVLQKGNTHTTSYIPEVYANVGSTLKLKNEHDQWDNGWVVTKAGEKIDAEYVETNERNYMRQRKASDI